MSKIAFLFAGQGSQAVGMGKDLYENIPAVAKLFDEAEKYRKGTLKQMFEGEDEELKKTKNTQPCLFLADLAAAKALEENGIKADAAAGFSLGEIVGVGYSGALSIASAFELVCERGLFMQKAADEHKGSMIAVMKYDKEKLIKASEEAGVYPVNFNCPGQIVVSGDSEKIDSLKEVLSSDGARIIPLPVGGPFHSPFMKEASEGLAKCLSDNERFPLKKTDIPLYANKNALPYTDDIELMKETLSGQISNPVLWEDTLINMSKDNIDTFIECGPGKTLSGFVKRTLPEAKIFNVSDMDSLNKTLEELKRN